MCVQVTIKVNNQRAACGGGLGLYQTNESYSDPCSFVYDPTTTPNVTDISTDSGGPGSFITLHGTEFSSDPYENFVLFGDIECNVTSCDSTYINCTLGYGQGGNNKPLWVHVLPVGVADTNELSLQYGITVESVSPSSSGLGGGVEAVITGSGFTTVLNDRSHIGYTYSPYQTLLSYDCLSWKNRVSFGSVQATILSITSNSIHCMIPPSDSNGSRLIIVEVYCADEESTETYEKSQSGLFTYDDSLSPTVTSISPLDGSGEGGTTVTISGNGFTNDTTIEV